MDEDAEQFWCLLLETALERGGKIVDAGKRQLVGEGAMAGDVNTVAHVFHFNVMGVEYFRKLSSDRSQPIFQLRITLNARSCFYSGGFAFDVSEDGCNFRVLPSDLGLHVG